jgi:hypothetical protein
MPEIKPVKLNKKNEEEASTTMMESSSTSVDIPVEHSFNRVNEEIPAPQEETVMKEAPKVTCSIESAAALFAEGYRQDTHKGSLLAFCRSTGYPSYGTMDQMIEVLRKYGYPIKELR